MQLFDAHCHLQDERLGTLQDVVQQAASNGVQQLACNGCWAGDDWARVAAAAAEHPAAIVPNFGLHPWWLAQRSPGWLKQLREMLVAYPRAGLGECGLDRGPRGPAVEWAVQLEAFEQQLQLAQELLRPVSIHCVKAYGAVNDVLRRLNITVPVVLHSWTGAVEMTTTLLQLPNVHVSLSGHITKLAPHKALPMIRAVPLERLLLESDSPDGLLQLSPAWLAELPSLRSLPQQLADAGLLEVNRPCVLPWTLQLVAAALCKPAEEVAGATYANAQRVFRASGMT
ncbi:putative metal-dependent hydrolase YabD [Chlorella vulgaris]